MKPPVATVDGRENEMRVVGLQALGIDAKYDPKIQFEWADYSWVSEMHSAVCGLQLKSISETINRFKQRELGWILRGLHEDYDIPIFLMYGGVRPSPEGWCQLTDWKARQRDMAPIRLSYDGLMNYLFHSLPRDLPGILVEWVPDEQTAIGRIASLVKYWQTETTGATWMPRKQRVLFNTNPEEEAALGFLMGFPEIGEEIAKRILNSGMSLAEVIQDAQNGAERIKQIQGIGPERVKAITALLEYRK